MNKVTFFDIFNCLIITVAGFFVARVVMPWLLSYPSDWTVAAAIALIITQVTITAYLALSLIRKLLHKDSAIDDSSKTNQTQVKE